MKLREGNVFTGICLSTRGKVHHMHHRISRCPRKVHFDLGTYSPFPWMSDLGTYPPPQTALLLTSGGHHSRIVQTCSLEDLTPSPNPSPQCWHLVVATDTRTVGKWVVRILLECSLVAMRTLLVRFEHLHSY